jgi:uroporphyrin-III C-methyltransferase
MDTPPPPDPITQNDRAAAPVSQSRWNHPALVQFALGAIVVILLLFAWHWFDSRRELNALQTELARRLAESDTQSKESRNVANQTRDAVREAQIKLGVLEAKLQESQNQQIALEALYQELSRTRDESVLADIEQTLLFASQQLQLAGNVKAALLALQSADNRLQRVDRPQLAPVRKLIARDIERLKLAPYLDVIGISARLDNLVVAIDALPLAMELRPAREALAGKPGAEEASSAWSRLVRELWHELRDLVRVENMDRPDAPLLAPNQMFFLRENLKLRLLGARLALLARDEKSFKADLKAAGDWLGRYYDARDKAVAGALENVRQLQESQVSIDVPDISASLDAVRNYRLTRERGR